MMCCSCLMDDVTLVDMECVLRIEASEGWEKSMTAVLESFEDLSYEINPAAGFTYVKGKGDPTQILSQLSKAGQHATIEWISHGFPREDQNQFQNLAHGYNNSHMIPQGPFNHHASYPYLNYQHNGYHLNNHPYPNWYNMPQNALPYGNQHVPEHQRMGHSMFEGRNFSGQSYDSNCPVRSNNHHSDSENASPTTSQQETNNVQTNVQPTHDESSGFLKKFFQKLCFTC